MPHTLATGFDPRRNSLNALRLLLATLVIVSHSWPLGGFGEDPMFGDRNLGRWSVAGFFAISGYLITRSRDRTDLGPYLWRRVLRIYPGFFVSLLVVAFVFAPLAAVVGPGRFLLGDSVGFVVHNAGLLIQQWNIGGTLASAPAPNAWNGALWTLFYEFLCYVGIGVMVSVLPRRWLPAAVVAVFVVATASRPILDATNRHIPGVVQNLAELAPFFFAGAVLYLFGRRVPAHRWGAAGAATVLAVIMMTGVSGELAALPIAYLCMWLGMTLPLIHVGRENDFSYGMYVYGFPVQQVLALLGAAGVGVIGFIGLSVALTVPLAAASWFMVEKPALRLKDRGPAGVLRRLPGRSR